MPVLREYSKKILDYGRQLSDLLFAPPIPSQTLVGTSYHRISGVRLNFRSLVSCLQNAVLKIDTGPQPYYVCNNLEEDLLRRFCLVHAANRRTALLAQSQYTAHQYLQDRERSCVLIRDRYIFCPHCQRQYSVLKAMLTHLKAEHGVTDGEIFLRASLSPSEDPVVLDDTDDDSDESQNFVSSTNLRLYVQWPRLRLIRRKTRLLLSPPRSKFSNFSTSPIPFVLFS